MYFSYRLNNKAVFEFNITLHNNINIADDEGDIIKNHHIYAIW